MKEDPEVSKLRNEILDKLQKSPANWGDWSRMKSLDFKDLIVKAKKIANSKEPTIDKLQNMKMQLSQYYDF